MAVKIFKKGTEVADSEAFHKEIKSLKMMDYPVVVRLLEVIETATRLYLVLELVLGKELFDAIVERQSFTEPEACYIFTQLLKGVGYCHENGMVHRDLKPENILITKTLRVKIVDFGFANMVTSQNALLATPCGSPYYAAPEVLSGKAYAGKGIDVWSLGVILYVMVAGYLPFDDDNVATLFGYIKAGDYEIPENVSPDFIDLVGRMLVVDPRKRATVADLLKHPWITNTLKNVPTKYLDSLAVRNFSEPDPDILKAMQEFGYSPAQVAQHLKANGRNAMTASYYLLYDAKQRAAHNAQDVVPDFSRAKVMPPRLNLANLASAAGGDALESGRSSQRSQRSLASVRATPRPDYDPRKDTYLDDDEVVVVKGDGRDLSPRSRRRLEEQAALSEKEPARRASQTPSANASANASANVSRNQSPELRPPQVSPVRSRDMDDPRAGGGGKRSGPSPSPGAAGSPGIVVAAERSGAIRGIPEGNGTPLARPGSSRGPSRKTPTPGPGDHGSPIPLGDGGTMFDRRVLSAPEKQETFLPPIVKANWEDLDEPSNVNQRPTPAGFGNQIGHGSGSTVARRATDGRQSPAASPSPSPSPYQQPGSATGASRPASKQGSRPASPSLGNPAELAKRNAVFGIISSPVETVDKSRRPSITGLKPLSVPDQRSRKNSVDPSSPSAGGGAILKLSSQDSVTPPARTALPDSQPGSRRSTPLPGLSSSRPGSPESRR